MMTVDQIYQILCEVVKGLSLRNVSIKTFPDQIEAKAKLTDFGLNVTNLPEILGEMKERLGGADLNVSSLFTQEALNQCTLADLVSTLRSNSKNPPVGKIVVYVDDEEENLFIFKRKYGKRFNLKTFTNSMEALSFIQQNNSVGLVITDEVMPNLNGTALCDEVHRTKPKLKFILITGNPNGDQDLMYLSLRRHRFYDFINKPVDFEAKGEEYFTVIEGLLSFDW